MQIRMCLRALAEQDAIIAARLKRAALMLGPCRAGEAGYDAGDVDRPH